MLGGLARSSPYSAPGPRSRRPQDLPAALALEEVDLLVRVRKELTDAAWMPTPEHRWHQAGQPPFSVGSNAGVGRRTRRVRVEVLRHGQVDRPEPRLGHPVTALVLATPKY
jgi:hypothetical protein